MTDASFENASSVISEFDHRRDYLGGKGFEEATGRASSATKPLSVVIPGWSEGPDPESRDSGFDASHRPGMTLAPE